MSSYKDQTFCADWCDNTSCFRNYSHIVEAQKEGGFLNQNPNFPVCYFINIPMDCKERTPKHGENNMARIYSSSN